MDNGWRNALLSCIDGPITDDQRDALQSLQASWVILNDRNGRFFIDIIGPINELLAIQQALVNAGRDPIVIAVFDYDGNMTQGPNKAAWLAVANDVVTYNADGTVATTTRPTAYVEVHKWSGWADKVIA